MDSLTGLYIECDFRNISVENAKHFRVTSRFRKKTQFDRRLKIPEGLNTLENLIMQ